ncbi:unnamed protein product (macronuclear) [Paramecium tetraurelia]|uniref:Uncharacterized protein n=1 Tax=Paramecium tetraurelia TaxID=5888 RepID=A0C5L8_PARTE|nr:uncharacterized protein GSPATT00035214001 [Paramecium tetraurelia]CAK66085.1 unnamed protein product [Paramecium tetraurelia]|eukprot:XP_001433482.1 hypothetical protein (macronuclear) [Paramecium tetraurelia strain d4-2]
MYSGEYNNGKKVGRWVILYKKEEIGGGLYDRSGDEVKVDVWVEIIGSFNSDSKVTCRGEYRNSKKIGRWDIFHKYEGRNQKIGGGSYDEQGDELKIGQWMEISDFFNNFSQVIYNGLYKNGKKVGYWYIWEQSEGNYERIGGGSYEVSGNEFKVGRWVETSNNYSDISQVTYKGEYNNGLKIGGWDIWYKYEGKSTKIGGGQYDESGNEFKLGPWVEISDVFNNFSQVTYNSQYKNDKKVGRWDVWYQQEGKNEKIGGGSYDELGDELKVGQWVEISNNYRDNSQVTYNGEYNNGIKIGQWDIYQRIGFDQPIQKIGGGQYDNVGHGVKFGQWIELHDEFMNTSQVTFNGEYRNNRKVNRWDIFFNSNGENKLIGGGLYDNEEREDLAPGKLGKWIELDYRFNEYQNQIQYDRSFQVTHQGEYKNNKQTDRWDTYFQDRGGSYNENGIKDGQWGLLTTKFSPYKLTLFLGLFTNGEKVGNWILMNIKIEDHYIIFVKIGEKTYENEKQY